MVPRLELDLFFLAELLLAELFFAEAPAAGAFDLPAAVFRAEVLEAVDEGAFFWVAFVDVDLLLEE